MKKMSNTRKGILRDTGNKKGIIKHKCLHVAYNEILRFTNKDLIIYLDRYWEKLNVGCLIDKNLEMLLLAKGFYHRDNQELNTRLFQEKKDELKVIIIIIIIIIIIYFLN